MSDDIEKKFREVVAEYAGQIEAKLDAAGVLIKDAVKLAEESGLPFRGYCLLRQTYTPQSFETKWEGLEEAVEAKPDGDFYEFMDELVGASPDEYAGWEASAIC